MHKIFTMHHYSHIFQFDVEFSSSFWEASEWIILNMNIWKLFSRFFKRTFGDSSIHGFGYIVKSDLHFLEKWGY